MKEPFHLFLMCAYIARLIRMYVNSKYTACRRKTENCRAEPKGLVVGGVLECQMHIFMLYDDVAYSSTGQRNCCCCVASSMLRLLYARTAVSISICMKKMYALRVYIYGTASEPLKLAALPHPLAACLHCYTLLWKFQFSAYLTKVLYSCT